MKSKLELEMKHREAVDPKPKQGLTEAVLRGLKELNTRQRKWY